MMHLTFSDKSLLLGKDAAELVVEYAAALARTGSADTVKLNAYGADGDKVEATLLLDQGAPLMVETSRSDLPEPDNDAVVVYMQDRMTQLAAQNQATPLSHVEDSTIADFEHSFDLDSGEPPSR